MPYAPIIVQGVLSIVLVLVRNLEQLTNMVVVTGMVFNVLVVLACLLYTSIQKEGYSSALIMLERNSLSTAVIDIPIIPIDTTPIKIKVLWKRDLYKRELNQFVELLKQYDKSCDAIA